MVIYMQNPVHGTKVAISEEEAKADEKNGWKRFDPSANSGVLEGSAPDAESAELETARAAYQAKFGKAAHHKKSLETLRQELAKDTA